MLENKKTQNFCLEIKQLAKKYNLSFFSVTDSINETFNTNYITIKKKRDYHIIWKQKNKYNNYKDWSKYNETKN